MVITNVKKIFIDIDDELIFILDNIKQSEEERLLLIVPKNAIVVSSRISVKVLARMVYSYKKNVIIVSEDEFVLRLAEEAGLVSVNKISAVDDETWEKVSLTKNQYLDKLKEGEKDLLKERGINIGSKNTSQAKEEGVEEESIEEDLSDEEIEDDEIETEEIESPIPEAVEIEDEEEEFVAPIQRKPLSPKNLSIGGITIVAGGDVKEFKDSSADAIVAVNSKDENKVARNLTGVDFSAKPNQKNGILNRKKGKFKPRKDRKPFSKRKWGIIALLIAIILGAVGYLVMFMLPQSDITISFATQEVPIETEITINTSQQGVDLESITLQAQKVTETDLSISGNGTATGKSIDGVKASGIMEFWNKTDRDVVLNQGTEIESVSTGLKYVLAERVTLEAANTSDDGITDPGGVGLEDRITAFGFGNEYNITESDTDTDFKVDKYSTSEVIGKRFRSFSGGQSREFTSVSEEDVDKLEKELLESLEEQGITRLRNLVASGYRIIQGTQEIKVLTKEVSPEIGEEAEDFTLSITAQMDLLSVADNDLGKVVEFVISSQDELPENFQVATLDDLIITDVQRSNDSAKFLINSKGSLRLAISEQQILDNVKSKSYLEAKDYLDSLNGVSNIQFLYSPSWIPESVRLMPQNESKIQVRFID